MFLLIISIAWFVFLSSFLWKIGKIYFGREVLIPGEYQSISNIEPFVTVIIPARNEESSIEDCVLSIIAQSYPENRLKIVVVDDNSIDKTASIVEQIANKYNNLIFIQAGTLPMGWAGKNHACWQGSKIADGDWLCFIDADTTANPELLRSAVSFSEAKGIDMLSINPFQDLLTFTERALLPGVFLSIASTLNFTLVNDPSKPHSGANGQFILFRKSVYNSTGGHFTVRSEIMEDMAFAELIKKSGYRLYWIFGDELIHTRMYRNFLNIWEGLSKNLVDIMKEPGTITSFFRALRSFVLGWAPLVLPIINWLQMDEYNASDLLSSAFILSLTASIVFLAFYSLSLRALKIPYRYIITLPLGFTLHTLLTFNSWRNKLRGKREWKGRIYG